MKNKALEIIGNTGLRNIPLGTPITVIQETEGTPDSIEEHGALPYYEYDKELDTGEELTIYYSYDNTTKKVVESKVYFYFYPIDHDESTESFHAVKNAIVSKYMDDYGAPSVEEKGKAADYECYYHWEFTQQNISQQIYMIVYSDEDDFNPDDSREVIKITLSPL